MSIISLIFSGKSIIGSEVLIIGMAINHPGGKPMEECVSSATGISKGNSKMGDDKQQQGSTQHPSIVGYSANIGKNPFEFVGDIVFQVSFFFNIPILSLTPDFSDSSARSTSVEWCPGW